MQCDPNVMRGLQEIIPSRRMNIELRTLASDGKKVSISIQQARKELKGRGAERKNPPEMPSFDDNTPPASNFLSNAGNRAHRNRLSSAPLHPVMLMMGTPKDTPSSPPPMMVRVQKRVMDKLFDAANSPQTKRCAACPKRCHLHDSCRPLPGCPVLAGDFYYLHRPSTCIGIGERR